MSNNLVLVSEGMKEAYLFLKQRMNIADDKHPESVLEWACEDGIIEDYEEFDADDWDDEGKYQHASPVYTITTKGGETFLINVAVSRSGSYFSDYYYTIDDVNMVTHKQEVVTRVVDVYTSVKF